MAPSSLRLQMVRSLAQVTQTTAAEIEALFELAQPVARTRIAPPKTKRNAPMGLERQMMRILVAHPSLAMMLDVDTLQDVAKLSPDSADMLTELVIVAQEMGETASFAALAEQLHIAGPDFDALIAEVAEQTETDLAVVKMELAGALRQVKTQSIKQEMEQLAATGLRDPLQVARYRELMQLQELYAGKLWQNLL